MAPTLLTGRALDSAILSSGAPIMAIAIQGGTAATLMNVGNIWSGNTASQNSYNTLSSTNSAEAKSGGPVKPAVSLASGPKPTDTAYDA